MFYYEEESQVGDHNFYQPQNTNSFVMASFSPYSHQVEGTGYIPHVPFEDRMFAERLVCLPRQTEYKRDDPVQFYPLTNLIQRPATYYSLQRAKSLRRARAREQIGHYSYNAVRSMKPRNLLDHHCLMPRGQPVERRFSTLGHLKRPTPVMHRLHHGTIAKRDPRVGQSAGRVQKSHSLRQTGSYSIRRFASDASEFLQQRISFQSGQRQEKVHSENQGSGFAKRFNLGRRHFVQVPKCTDGYADVQQGTKYVGSLDRRLMGQGAIDKRSKMPKPPRSSKKQTIAVQETSAVINLSG